MGVTRDVLISRMLADMRYDLLDSFVHTDNPGDRRRDLLMCAIGCLGLALIGALIARWLLIGGLGNGTEILFETRRYRGRTRLHHEARAAWWLIGIGGAFTLLSLILALLGLYSLAAAALRRS